MADKVFTYTGRRIGAKTPDGVIVKCAHCGRHGAGRFGKHDYLSGLPWHDEVIHGGVILDPVGLMTALRQVNDHCTLPFTPEQKVEADAWEAAYKATQSASKAKRAAQEALAQYRAEHGLASAQEVTHG